MKGLEKIIGKTIINVIPIYDSIFGDLEKLQFIFSDDTDLIVYYDHSTPDTYLDYDYNYSI